MSKEWFVVDRKGLAKILRRRGIEFAVFELIQNAWDEPGVTTVRVNVGRQENGLTLLHIDDDAPDGFKNLSHAFTLFAESAKKTNAEQRGRFNLGEKLVLALCETARITSTTGSVTFDNKTGRRVRKSQRTERGSELALWLRMTKAEIARVGEEIHKLIPPAHIRTTFNGTPIAAPNLVKDFDASLPTEIADDQGNLRPGTRIGVVRVYRKNHDAPAFIYEMGIPVVEHDCAFHVDVQQKVPLTLDRENVTPRFLRAMRTAVFNATHELVTKEEATAEWAQTAVENPDAQPEAVKDYMEKRFGALRVSFDPSDPEANNKAVSHGYTLVHGGMLSGAAWANVRGFEAITPAGRVFPTHPGNGIPFEQADETSGMKAVREYAQKAALVILGCDITVEFGKQPTREAASWISRRLQFNVRNLGVGWFNLHGNRVAIDDLIIHEFGHHYESNHLDEAYYRALTRIAAKWIQAVREGRL